jgi:hypothetical protein
MKGRILVFLLLLSLTSCSYLTKSGRQQRAYEKYVRKSSLNRDRQRFKLRSQKIKIPFRYEEPAVVNSETVESPQSVTPGESPPP